MENKYVKSEDFNDMIEMVPSWFIRWGTSIVIILFSLVLTMGCVIKFPETVTSEVELINGNYQFKVVSKINGYLNLIRENGQLIKSGETIGFISNTNDDKYIFSNLVILKDKISEINEKVNKKELVTTSLDDLGSFGELSARITSLRSSIHNYNLFFSTSYGDKKKALYGALENLKASGEMIKTNIKSYNDQLALVRNKFTADSILYGRKVISRQEFENSKNSLLEVIRMYNDYKTNLFQNGLQKNTLEEEMFNFDSDLNSQIVTNLNLISNTLEELKMAILDWENLHLIRSNIDGHLNVITSSSSNLYVNATDLILTIVPDDKDISARAVVGNLGVGKIKLKQSVNLKLYNFPSEDYGMLLGNVTSISKGVNTDGNYIVSISLRNGLETSYGKRIDFVPDIKGQCSFIVEDLTLTERIFRNIRTAINN